MDQITRGVRELIRVVMRERGIKHRSDQYHVHTVCYAEQPRRTVEYEGPVYITFEAPVVHCVAFSADRPLPLHRYQVRHTQTAQQALQNLVMGGWFNGISRRKEDKELNPRMDELKIDVHRPDFGDVLGAFLDKHIQDHNKRPAKWKRRYKDTDQEYVFVPDEVVHKEVERFTLGRMIVTWTLRKWFNIDPYDLDFAWRHAVRRHFRVDDDELKQIQQTAEALRKVNKKDVRENTKRILNDEWTEF